MQILWNIEWTDEFLTGFDEIDTMHEALAFLINELYEFIIDIEIKADSEKISGLVNQIEYDLLAHFEQEEKIFREHNLHCLERQILQHEEFKREMNKVNSANPPLLVKAVMISQIAVIYLDVHLKKEDKICIKELKEKIGD